MDKTSKLESRNKDVNRLTRKQRTKALRVTVDGRVTVTTDDCVV